jgi:glycosyltransferase involved in cell wall biosynthesis
VRLLLAIAELAAGGAESVVIDLATDAAQRGDEVAVVAAPGPLDRRLDGVKLTRLPLPPQAGGIARTPRTMIALRSALRRFGPDLIHAHNPRVTASTRAAKVVGGGRRTPLLATYHAVAPEHSRMAARLLRGADLVTCASEPLLVELATAGVRSERLVAIRNGTAAAAPLDLQRSRELDDELELGQGPVVTAVGRLAPQKNHARFLAAVALAAPETPDARFLIVGDGPLRASLEARARELGLGGHLRFTGIRADARDVIARSDLLVLSSDWEGLPLVALEGMAAGVPLLSTAVSGIEDLTTAGAAEAVEPDEVALAAGITRLLSDPDRRRAMGERARDLHAREFSVERMVEEYRRLYGELLAGVSRRPRP